MTGDQYLTGTPDPFPMGRDQRWGLAASKRGVRGTGGAAGPSRAVAFGGTAPSHILSLPHGTHGFGSPGCLLASAR